MDTISDKELIDKFLSKQLLESERLLFDKRKKEEDFLVLLEESIIAYQGRLALKEKLKNIGTEVKSKPKTFIKKPLIWISGIAASLLLFFALQFFNSKPLSSDVLFTTYFEAYPNMYATKGDSDNRTIVKKALEFYDKTQYKEAIALFQKKAIENSLNASEHFYFGISSLAIDKLENAKKQLRQVTKKHPLYSEAQWYLSLALIKQDSINSAKTILYNKNLIFSTHRNDMIKKLLNQIK